MQKRLFIFCFFLGCVAFVGTAQTLPTTIPGLTAWFSADALELVDGATVDVWNNNNSSYPMELVAPTDGRYRPTLAENAINDKPAVRFNGTNQYLNGGNVLNIGNEGQSIFVITKANNNANNRTLFAKAANGTTQFTQNKYAVRCTTLNRLYFEYTDLQTYRSQLSETLEGYAIISTAVNARDGAVSFFVNSKKVDEFMTRQNHVFNSNFDFLLGAYNNAAGTTAQGSTYFNGDIAEMIVYNSTLTQQERQSVDNYLRLKYFPGTERLPISLGNDVTQPYSLQNLELEVPDSSYFTGFTWNTGETTRNIVADKSGAYSVFVTDNWGWEYYDTIIFSKPDINQLRDTLLCVGDTLTWDCGIGDAGDYSYSWSNGESTRSIKIYNPGDYWVEVEDSDGNIARSKTIRVDVDNFPAEASLGDETELCTGNFLELVSGDTTNIVSYEWNTGATTPHLPVSESGRYWLKATNANNCVVHDTISITVNGIAPETDFSVENACENQITTLRQTSTTSDGSHITHVEWTIGNETFDNSTILQYSFANVGNHLVKLQVTSSSGCRATMQKIVTINPEPKVNFTPLVACQHVETVFQPYITITQGSISRYEWNVAGESIVTQKLRKTFPVAEEVPIQLEVTSNKGCKNRVQNTVQVRSMPELNISYFAECEHGQAYFFDRTAYTAINNATSRTWFVNNQVAGNNAVFSTILNETSNVKYTVRTMNGCELSWGQEIELAPLPVVVLDNVYSCTNTEITMTDQSEVSAGEIVERTWRINNIWHNEATPTVTFDYTGTYNVVLIARTENNCVDSLQSTIVIENAPEAKFSITPEAGGVASVPMLFHNNSTYATHYKWIFSESEIIETGTTASITHTFADSINTQVQLFAHSLYGCVDSVKRIIPLQDAHFELEIFDCTFSRNSYGVSTHIYMRNTGNVPIRHINFMMQQNAVTPYSDTWNGEIQPGGTLVFTPARITQNPIENISFVTVQAQILDALQGNVLFTGHFSKDLTNSFTLHSFGPVPARETLSVKFSSANENPVTIALYDVHGKTSAQWNFNTGTPGFYEYELDVSALASGRYTFQITQGNHTIQKSLLIQ